LLILILAITSTGIFAQGSVTSGKKWTFLVEPYLMFPNMDGKTGIGDLPDVEVSAVPGNIFSKTNLAM
jgi:hypothetical protein